MSMGEPESEPLVAAEAGRLSRIVEVDENVDSDIPE
jgi:hypothetical protein